MTPILVYRLNTEIDEQVKTCFIYNIATSKSTIETLEKDKKYVQS